MANKVQRADELLSTQLNGEMFKASNQGIRPLCLYIRKVIGAENAERAVAHIDTVRVRYFPNTE